MVVAGLAIGSLLPTLPGAPWFRYVLGPPLILLASTVSVVSYLEWADNQRALRHGEPLPRSRLPRILAFGIAALALVITAVAICSALAGQR
jgi:putative membrane protein